MAKLTEERIQLALKLRKEGHTLKEVAKQLGVGKARAGTICSDGIRLLEEKLTAPFYGLPTRIRNAIHGELSSRSDSYVVEEFPSPDVLREWVRSKELYYDSSSVLLRGKPLINMGRKSFLELCKWLGLEECAPVRKTPLNRTIKRARAVLIKAGYKPPTK